MATPVSPLRRIVVSGATGKQGGALISALVSKPSHLFEIYAVTRDKTSKSAQSLASKPNVHLIEGNFKDPAAIFKQVQNPWGLFSVTLPLSAKIEEEEGKAMTAAAIEAGVKHIVFTATDRGGQVKSDTEPTAVPHFASKYRIELDIIEKSKQSGGTWTLLRPVAFFENLSNNFLGKAFTSIWRLNGTDRKLQLISTADIGKVAAEAFLKADSDEYRNRSISLAGDDLSLKEAECVFKAVTGQPIIETYSFIGRIIKWLMHEQLGIMFNWFKSDGFGVDVPVLRSKYPYLKDFKTWLETESAWKT